MLICAALPNRCGRLLPVARNMDIPRNAHMHTIGHFGRSSHVLRDQRRARNHTLPAGLAHPTYVLGDPRLVSSLVYDADEGFCDRNSHWAGSELPAVAYGRPPAQAERWAVLSRGFGGGGGSLVFVILVVLREAGWICEH